MSARTTTTAASPAAPWSARPCSALLADIAAGKIDIVVVYKVDRLTRSLADFAKIVEVFDAHGVSFVSVTQQFNTTTSMGRLTLNVLLSFAQFEREVTGERIRDKIAASKRKGMWMGGTRAARLRGERTEPVQHIDGRVVGDGPGRFAFDDIGDEKGSAAGRQQRAHRGREPQSIGVGLHHRAAFRAAGQPRHRAPIIGEGGEVDDQNAGFRRVRRLGPGPQARSGFVDSHLAAILGRKRRRPDGDGILL